MVIIMTTLVTAKRILKYTASNSDIYAKKKKQLHSQWRTSKTPSPLKPPHKLTKVNFAHRVLNGITNVHEALYSTGLTS